MLVGQFRSSLLCGLLFLRFDKDQTRTTDGKSLKVLDQVESEIRSNNRSGTLWELGRWIAVEPPLRLFLSTVDENNKRGSGY